MGQKADIFAFRSTIRRVCAALTALLIFSPLVQYAQPAPSTSGPTAYSIVQNGPHSRVWQCVTTQTNLDGSVQSKTGSYTELATGLNHLVAGQWVASSETIQVTPDGAAATNGQHQVYFANNINTPGGIQLVTPDNQQMRSEILGLAYFDASNSNSVMFATLQDSGGQILPSLNQVLYTNAFTNVDADVRYTYTRAGLEQDVILRTQPPTPESVAATTSIGLWDCQLHAGSLYSTDGGINLTNCLLERVWVTNDCDDDVAPYIRNCTFRGGSLNIDFSNTGATIQDNLFDQTLINDHGYSDYTAGENNGYVTVTGFEKLSNNSYPSTPDVFLSSSPSYQTGELGNYYLPSGSSLINAGYESDASTLGFYLYCTTTNELAETNSRVDIGYHYVALNPIGVPTNLDIVPDLLYYRMTDYVAISFPTSSDTFTDYVADSAFGDDGRVSPNVAGSVVSWRPNQTGFYTGAIHFNGRSTVLDTGNNSRFNFTSQNFTVNLWVTLDGAAAYSVLIGNGTYNGTGWYVGLDPDGDASMTFNTSSGGAYIGTSSPVVSGAAWTMLTFVRTGTSTVLIYVNGSPYTSTTTGGATMGNPVTCSDNLWLGMYHGDHSEVLDGEIGVVRIYSGTLTATQVLSLYANGLTGLVR